MCLNKKIGEMLEANRMKVLRKIDRIRSQQMMRYKVIEWVERRRTGWEEHVIRMDLRD